MLLTLVQYAPCWRNADASLRHLDELLHHQFNTDLIVLPEMFSTGFLIDPNQIDFTQIEHSLKWMQNKSVELNCAIAGSLPFKDGDEIFNRFFWVHNGEILHFYNKKHLFTYGKEDQNFRKGNHRVIIQFLDWKIFPLICYDIRFPVWCRNDMNYDMMLVVASWPSMRIAHWDALLRARAIENQCYVVAVNRIGMDGNGIHHNGHSCVIHPNGEYLIFVESDEKLLQIEVSKNELQSYRKKFPFLKDRDNFIIC